MGKNPQKIAINPLSDDTHWKEACIWLNRKKTLKSVDFFCGAGGLSIGFERAGFETVFATDWDAAAIETFNFNRPGKSQVAHQADIKTLFLDKIAGQAFKADVVTGGPPCQSFSTANRQRIIDDPRNNLYKEFVRCCDAIKPKAIVMENVLGIRKVAEQILEDFRAIGYLGEMFTFNAAKFGVPQNRRRVIFVLFRANGNKSVAPMIEAFKASIEKAKAGAPERTLSEAISGLRPLIPKKVKNRTDIEDAESGFTVDKPATGGSKPYLSSINGPHPLAGSVIFNHKARYNNPRDVKIFGRLPQGGNSLHPSIADIMPYKSRNGIFKDKYFKLVAGDACKTVCAHMKFDCNMYIHPTQPRGLTPRESARVQTFPDNYVFKGTLGQWYQQIGNAVPPLLAFHIAEALKSALK
jgi:DNA (cytosine-5)-methyltransferase 1